MTLWPVKETFLKSYYITLIKKKKQPVQAQEVEVIDTIDDFGYELNENETNYYNDLFNKLKDILKNSGNGKIRVYIKEDPNFTLEFHIDTDDGNGSLAKTGEEVEIIIP